MVRVLIVGYGYWGPNLVRNVVQCPTTEAVGVCDRDTGRRARAQLNFPFIPTFADLDDGLDACDAVILATPASTHYPLAVRCLDAGKHLLIEKPLASSTAEGRDLVARASRANRVLMVDHTFVYSPAVKRVKQLIEAGELGEIHYVDSVRINLGLVQNDINVVWDLAPHDLSIIDHLLDRWPRQVTAVGRAHVNEREDVALLTLDYGDRVLACVHVNWLSPVKIRQLVLGGSRKSVVLNDLEPTDKVRVFDRRVERINHPEDKHKVLIDYRLGDSWSPYIGTDEPLQGVVRHFAECIAGGKRPVTDGRAGVRILELLEAADRSMAQGGVPVSVGPQPYGEVHQEKRRAA
jgi:predicted dehydrogenase